MCIRDRDSSLSCVCICLSHEFCLWQVLEEEGDTEVHPWNIYLEEADFYYAGQFSSINDCMYRHLRTSRYLLFGDVDELFVPRHQPSLVELLDQELTRVCKDPLTSKRIFPSLWVPLFD